MAVALVAISQLSCGGEDWTVGVYDNSSTAILVKVILSDGAVTRPIGSDSQGFVFIGPARPRSIRLEVLDATTCEVIGSTDELPMEHTLVVFGPDNHVGVSVDDPGDMPRVMLPAVEACH